MSQLEESKKESSLFAKEIHNLREKKSQLENFPEITERLETSIKTKIKKIEPLKKEIKNISKEIT